MTLSARSGAVVAMMIVASSCARTFVVPADRETSAAAPLQIPRVATQVVVPPDAGTVYLATEVPAEFYLSSRGTTVIVNGAVVMRRGTR